MNISTLKKSEDSVNYFEWTVQLNRYLMDGIGLWPADYRSRRHFTTLHAVLFLSSCLIVCTIPSVLGLIVYRHDLMLSIENLSYTIPVVVSHFKYIIIYRKRKDLGLILNTMMDDWAKPKPDVEKLVMIRWARNGRTVSVCLNMLIMATLVLMFVFPRFGITVRHVTNETDIRKTLPFPGLYAQVFHRSPYFEALLLAQFMVTWVIIGSYTGIDNFFLILIFHACGQLENLRARFVSIKESRNFDRLLTINVQDHIRLTRMVSVIEDSFTLMLLLMLLHFILFISVYGLLLVIMVNDKSLFQTIFTIVAGMTTFMQTFCYCFAGQLLTTQSENLNEAVYDCEWVNLQPYEARNLILIMVKTKTPIYITAGKLFPMTLLTFCSITKASASYISFLMAKFL